MEILTINSTANSGERASGEEDRSHKLHEKSRDSINSIDSPYNSGEDNVTSKSGWNTKRSLKAIFGSILFTSIAMLAGILTVCLTTPEPSKLCQSSFKAVIDGKSFQHNSNPYSIATGDCNRDDLLDIVVVNSGTNNIGVFFNDGNGTFTPQITCTTGDYSRPVSVVLADFNNDTYLDIAVANYDTHNIGVFLGYKNGTFANQITSSTDASRPVSMVVGDFNNDHWLDIVVANNGTSNIGIHFGYGNGYFENQITYSTGYDSLPYSVVVGDFNNDHYLDIAVANYGIDNIGIFLGYESGNFTKQITYSTGPRSSPFSVAVNDIDHDEQLDIAVANSGTNNIGIFFGYGNGSFRLQKLFAISPGSNPHSIVIGDFNQDNRLDIAVADYAIDNISLLIGYGNGSFAMPTMHSTGIDSSPFAITVGDFDNNNQSDIAVANFETNNILLLIEYFMMQSENPTTYSTGTGSNPYQIACGDIDNDTQLDLVVANSGTNNVGVFLGYGNGTFREQIIYSTGDGSKPYSVALSDLDNDHQLDIIVANANSKSVGILYGYGNGSFDTVMIYFAGDLSSPRWVTINDFNNDNHLDMAIADYGTSSLGIFLGYGNRTFGNIMTYPSETNSHPFSINAGDFNNDGRLDIAVACCSIDNIAIFLGSGNGTFTLFITYSTGDGSLPWMLTSADLNKDNHLDVIVANCNANNVAVFFGFGNGSFSTQLTYSTGVTSNPEYISIADFNNDHSLDIAVANSNSNNVGIFLGNSYGYFGNLTTYPTGSNSAPDALVVYDFNKDNRLDIAVANTGTNNIAILLGHPSEDSKNPTAEVIDTDGNQSDTTTANWITNDVPILLGDYYASFRSQIIYSTGSSSDPYSIAVGDLNNDTNVDLVVANSGNANLGILLGYGNGTFANEMIYSIGNGSNPQNVLVADFNKDTLLDVAVTNPRNDSIIVLLGNGNGTFSTEMTYSTGFGSNPSALAIGDFNNGNYLDLVVANKGTDTIGIFFGFDNTVFARQNLYGSGENSYPTSVAIADFNNDGQLDMVASLYAVNTVGVFLGCGNGTFTPIVIYADTPSARSWSVTVGDINNDNQVDIIVANWGADSISVLLGYGNGTFSDPILHSTGSETRPVSVAVGDFNNDHCLDLTTANYGGNSITVLLGYGNGSFQNILTFPTGEGSNPSSITIADVNNDNQPDIIVANFGTGSVCVFLGHGSGSFAEQMTFSTGIASAAFDAVAGDFNKDGRLDLAIANYGTSNVGILFGYGNGSFGNLQTYSTGEGSNPTHVIVADFNNDTQLDIIVTDETTPNAGVFFGYSDGTFTSMSIVPIEQDTSSYGAAFGDFNNDTRLDFVIADAANNNIGVFLAYGSNPFGGQTTFSVGEGSQPSSVAVGHFNNDNQLDIAIANSGTNSIGILFGYGNRLFSNITSYSTGDGSNPMSLAIGDFNNDSLTDIVVANSEINNIVVFMGYGNGNFSILMTYSTGDSSRPTSVAVGDFNRDHQMDIAVANFDTNNICILFGCGNESFTNETWYPLGYGSRPNWIIFKDLNNDSWEDIAVVTSGIDNIEILLNLC